MRNMHDWRLQALTSAPPACVPSFVGRFWKGTMTKKNGRRETDKGDGHEEEKKKIPSPD